MRRICLTWLIPCLLAVQVVNAEMLPEAKARLDRYQADMQSMRELLAKGNGEEALKLEKTARKELAFAIEVYDKAGIARSNDAGMLQDYAALRNLAGDYDLAAEALERVLGQGPQDAALLAVYGENLARVGPGRRQDAFDALRKALDLHPEPPLEAFVQRELGMLYREEGLNEFARECYERAHAIAPDEVRTRLALASLEAQRGEMAAAWSGLAEIGPAELQPHDVELRTLLRVALDDFDRYRRTFPDTAENQAAYARLLYQAARVPEAVMAANRAVRLNPADAETWKFLGDVQYQLGNAPQARKAYEKSLEANPDQTAVKQRMERLPQAPASQE